MLVPKASYTRSAHAVCLFRAKCNIFMIFLSVSDPFGWFGIASFAGAQGAPPRSGHSNGLRGSHLGRSQSPVTEGRSSDGPGNES